MICNDASNILYSDGLFAAASSDERKYWGFLLFMKIIDEGTLQRAEAIFTKNVVRCLMNQLAVEDRYLHRMAVKAAKTIQKRVSKEPVFASVVVKGLLSGSLQFDQITKTKTVEKIVLEADAASLQKIIERLERLIATPGVEETKAAASSRQYLADLFVSVVRTRSSAGGEYIPVVQYILSILVRYAYFGGKQGDANPAISAATQELFRNRINSCLNSLISNIKDPAEVAYAVVRQIRDLEKSEEYGKFIIEIDGSIAESVDAAFKSLKKLSSKVSYYLFSYFLQPNAD
jgi:DNA polymerase phi